MGKKKETKKETKKVYRANTKALSKIIIAIIVIFFLAIFAIPVKNGITYLYLNTWKTHEISKYHIQLKLPRAYQPLENNSQELSQIASSLISTDTSVKVNEKYVSQMPEVVYSGGSILNGVSLMIQCLSPESKTTKSLDDIAESQHILVHIYYEDDYAISDPQKEYVTIMETEAIRTATDLTNEQGTKTMIHYLIPMEDKEVTITFMGKKENVEKAKSEIEKIVKQMRKM